MNSRGYLLAAMTLLLTAPCFAQNDTSQQLALANAQSLDKLSKAVTQIAMSLDEYQRRLENLLYNASRAGGVNLTDSQQRLIFAYEVLNQTDQLAATLRKSIIETGEREANMRKRLKQVEFDLRQENMEKALAHYGTTKLDEARQQTREALNEERGILINTLGEISDGRIKLSYDLRSAEILAQEIRQTLFRQLRDELNKAKNQ